MKHDPMKDFQLKKANERPIRYSGFVILSDLGFRPSDFSQCVHSAFNDVNDRCHLGIQ